MSSQEKTPQPILEQILDEMFQKLGEEEAFNKETLEKLRNLSKTNSLIEKDRLLELLKESGGSR